MDKILSGLLALLANRVLYAAVFTVTGSLGLYADVDAAVNLILEFKGEAPTFAILKHNNACGLAQRQTMKDAYLDALAGDPTSAFGGVLIANGKSQAVTDTKLEELTREVRTHNNFAQRIPVLEEQMKVANHRIADLEKERGE